MAPLPLSIATLDSAARRALAQQHLVDQLDFAAVAMGAARRELDRLAAWVKGLGREPYRPDIDTCCTHTARLLGAMARTQIAQTASALALTQLDRSETVHRVVVARDEPGGTGG
jgi:hypothetical protein